jgi:hypothetical protein
VIFSTLRTLSNVAPVRLCATVAICTVAVAMTFLAIQGRLINAPGPEAKIKDTVERLRNEHPGAAKFFGELEDQRDKLAAAAQIQHAQEKKRSSLDWLAAEYSSGRLATRQRLLKMTLDKRNALLSDEDRIGFVAGYETFSNGLAEASPALATDYVSALEHLQGTADWGAVKDDPTSLVVWKELARERPDLWTFYVQNREWMRQPLADMDAAGSDDSRQLMIRVVQAAKDYHPLVQEAVTAHQLEVFGLLLFEEHGPILKGLRDRQVPLNEALELVYAYQDELPGRKASLHEKEAKVTELSTFRTRKPAVWQLASKGAPDVLWLDRMVPDLSDALCRKYGEQDIAVLLRTSYADDVRVAAQALVKFGDVAFYYLSSHAAQPGSRLRNLMRRAEVGVRAIPYYAKFGDKGIDQLEDDVRWLNEWFDAEGNEIKPQGEWLKAVPFVGAPLNVAIKLGQGRPITGEEIGWAALDVADCVLLVASFGTSSAATAARKGAEATGKAMLKSAGRRAEAKIICEAAEHAATKAVIATTRGPVLRGLLRIAGRVAESAEQLVSKARTTLRFGADKVGQGLDAWHSVPPTIRRSVYRGLLAVSLAVVVKERTLPILLDPEYAKKIGQFVGQVVADAGKSAAIAIATALNEMLRNLAGNIPWQWIIVPTVWAVCLRALWRLFSIRQPRRV